MRWSLEILSWLQQLILRTFPWFVGVWLFFVTIALDLHVNSSPFKAGQIHICF